MMARILASAVLALLLSGSLVELSCLTGEARPRAPLPSVFTDVPEPELPIVPEIDGFAPGSGAMLTQ